MGSLPNLCNQFTEKPGRKGWVQKGVCKVSLHWNIPVSIEGKQGESLFPADVWFDALNQQVNTLNMEEIAVCRKRLAVYRSGTEPFNKKSPASGGLISFNENFP